MFQAAVNGECHTMEHRWANSLTTLSPEIGTGALIESLALEKEEAQPPVFCPHRPPSSLAGTHIESLYALSLVPTR